MDVYSVGIWEVEDNIFANVNDTSDLRMKRTHFHIFIPATGDRRQDLAWLTSLVYFCLLRPITFPGSLIQTIR